MRLKTFDPVGPLTDLEVEYNNWLDGMISKWGGVEICATHFALDPNGFPTLLVFWDHVDEQLPPCA